MTLAELPRFRGIDKRAFLDQRHLSTAARIPSYRVSGGGIMVTFPLRPESRPESEFARGVLLALEQGPLGKVTIAEALGHRSISARLNTTIRGLLADGRIAFTIPEKPNSRLQKYRLVPSSETREGGGAKMDGSTEY